MTHADLCLAKVHAAPWFGRVAAGLIHDNGVAQVAGLAALRDRSATRVPQELRTALTRLAWKETAQAREECGGEQDNWLSVLSVATDMGLQYLQSGLIAGWKFCIGFANRCHSVAPTNYRSAPGESGAEGS